MRDWDDGEEWEEWLQTHRVELNAMTTPQFIAWLDRKMWSGIRQAGAAAGGAHDRRQCARRGEAARQHQRAHPARGRLEAQVATAIAGIATPSGVALAGGVKRLFKREPEREWRDHIEAEAKKRAGD